MEAIFSEIVDGEEQRVSDRLAKDPSIVSAVAAGRPAQYAGQSTLQVAVRAGQFSIARMLLAHGADPNFTDTDSPSGWAKSVLHDALAAAVKRSRWLRPVRGPGSERGWQQANDANGSDAAFDTLVALLDAGADVGAVDSNGSTPLGRAARAAHDVLPRRRVDGPPAPDGRPLNSELIDDLTRIFDALRTRGADPDRVEPQLDMSLSHYYEFELVGAILRGQAQADA